LFDIVLFPIGMCEHSCHGLHARWKTRTYSAWLIFLIVL